MIEYPDPKTPCIMWVAPFCLHDSSSGAAMQVKLMFEQLVTRGVRCHVVSALTFDSPNGTASFINLEEQLANQEKTWFNLEDNGVTYQYFKTKSRVVDNMTRGEESAFYQMFCLAMMTVKPDAIYLFGGATLEMAIIADAKRRGIKVCMGVYNGNYANFHFPNVDLIFTDTVLTARNYYNNSKINMMPTGTFIDPKKVVVEGEIDRKFITFINPSTVKGISILMRLALMAKKKHPDWQFLVVESRGTWAQAVQIYKQKPGQYDNVLVAQHTTDIRLVYQQTKVLVVPSLWYEGFGRVAAEATLNAIPVLASNSGGLPEAVNGGGICLPAPEKCVADYEYFPLVKECEEWFKSLEDIMSDKNYDEWVEKARQAGLAHNLEVNTDRVMAYLEPIFSSRPSFHPQYFIK